MKFEWNTRYEPHLKLVGLENFEVLYFLRAEFFEIFGRAILWRAVYPRGDLVLFGPEIIT